MNNLGLNFKETIIYYLFREVGLNKNNGLHALILSYKLMSDDVNVAHIYRAIVNYQIKKYGTQLSSDYIVTKEMLDK